MLSVIADPFLKLISCKILLYWLSMDFKILQKPVYLENFNLKQKTQEWKKQILFEN